jgi:protein-L-isoaspartate(D-aspartate) O-methyltransferase
MRVLEVGTGTGYNAALLAELVGAGNVTTVEVDATLADQAGRALHAAGYPVTVVSGDGTHGYPENAPYDRVIVTAGVHHVPYAWIAQTRPGGRLVVPFLGTFHPDSPLVVLTVREDGTAEGRFGGPGWFMPLRGQRLPQRVRNRAEERWAEAGKPDTTRFGITVTPEGQQIWLDSPANPFTPSTE